MSAQINWISSFARYHRLLALAWAATGSVASAASLHIDDFATGVAGWNSGGSTVEVVSDGGPLGDGDAFLQVSSTRSSFRIASKR